jgi:hypothetical protein
VVNSEKLIGTTEYLTLYTRCRINRCRYNRVRPVYIYIYIYCDVSREPAGFINGEGMLCHGSYGLSLTSHVGDCKPFRVGFVVDKVALEEVLLIFRLFHLTVISISASDPFTYH